MMVRAMFAPLARAVGLYFLVESLAWFLITAENVVEVLLSSDLATWFFYRDGLASGPGTLLAALVMLSGSFWLLLAANRIDVYLNGPLPLEQDQLDPLLDRQESLLRSAIPVVGLLCMAFGIEPLIDGLCGGLQAGADWAFVSPLLHVAQGLVRVVAGLWILFHAPGLARRLTRRDRDLPRMAAPVPAAPPTIPPTA
jgi:hypothetical protein